MPMEPYVLWAARDPRCTEDVPAAPPVIKGGFPTSRGLAVPLSEPKFCLVPPRHQEVKALAADKGQDRWAPESTFLIPAPQGMARLLRGRGQKSKPTLTVLDRKHSFGVSDEEGFMLQKISVWHT